MWFDCKWGCAMLPNRDGFPNDILISCLGRIGKPASYRKRQMIYAAGDRSEAFFFIKQGGVKLTVVSQVGREALTAILDAGDFFGPECLDLVPLPRATSAVALAALQVLKVERDAMLELMFTNREFCALLTAGLVRQIAYLHQEMSDSLLYNTEQRLARTLLLVATNNDKCIPHLSQQELANMIGTTRQRVNMLMQRFRKFGFIYYSQGLRVHNSMRNVAGL
jgi:CRP/FNR family transcriptional regulator, cyclic AMP receptor protein